MYEQPGKGKAMVYGCSRSPATMIEDLSVDLDFSEDEDDEEYIQLQEMHRDESTCPLLQHGKLYCRCPVCFVHS